jgi:hypothetical protein
VLFKDGSTYPIPYGREDQCIYSVGRRYINEILLDKGNTYDNIVYHFNHKLIKVTINLMTKLMMVTIMLMIMEETEVIKMIMMLAVTK